MYIFIYRAFWVTTDDWHVAAMKHDVLWNGINLSRNWDGDPDVIMGSYDGAETWHLVSLYLLDQMKDLGIERKPFYAGNN